MPQDRDTRAGGLVQTEHDLELKKFGEFDAECWGEAKERYENKQKLRTKNAQSFHINADLPCSALSVIQAASKAAAKFENNRRPHTRKLLWFAVQLQRHSKSIDVLIQSYPFAPAVWGTVRLVLDIITDKELASNVLIEGIHQVALHLDRWQQLTSIFAHSPRVRASLVDLYEAVLDFLTTATQYLPKRTWRRFGKSTLATVSDEFKPKIDRVKSAAKLLDEDVRTLAIKTQDKNSTKILSELSNTRELLNGRFDRLEEELAARGKLFSDLRSGEDPCSRPSSTFNNSCETQSKSSLFQGPFSSSRRWENSETDMEIILSSTAEQDIPNISVLRGWLRKAPPPVSPEDYRSPIPGTGNWLHSNERVRSWREGNGLKTLWITGKPGSGKSHLCEKLIDNLRDKQENLVAWYSFQKLSDPQRSTPSSFAASLLSQILVAIEGVYCLDSPHSKLCELRKTYPQGPHLCPLPKLWPIFGEILGLVGHDRTTFLIIDALDECQFDPPGPKAHEFLSELRQLLSQRSVRVAIFSRPTFDLLDLTKHCETIRIDQGLNAQDLQLYVTNELKDTDIPLGYQDAIRKRVQVAGEGSFLWAGADIKYLSQPCEQDTFMERLHHSPPGLDQSFDRITHERSSRLKRDEKRQRQILYELLCEAAEPLHLSIVAKWLNLGLWDPSKVITKIGGPLIEVKNGKVRFIHLAVKEWATNASRLPLDSPLETVFVDPQMSHARLAKECLRTLTKEDYGSKGKIGHYLRRNFAECMKGDLVQDVERETVTFEYAALYWKHHLIHVLDPDQALLELAQVFLHALQFSFWSEYIVYSKNDFSPIRVTYQHLREWFEQLPERKKPLINVTNYFAYPYLSLIKEYKKSASEDHVLPWLASITLARYLVDAGKALRALPLLVEATEGLTRSLGRRNPLTLRAMSDRSVLYLQQGKFHQANQDFSELVRILEEDSGPENPELFKNILNRGGTEYLMNHYLEAIASLDKAAVGFLKLCGADDVRYQNTQVWLSLVLVEIGNLQRALDILSKLLEQRWKVYGRTDIYASQVQYSIGDIHRKLGRQADSLGNLKESVAIRKKAFPLYTIWSLDPAISLLVAFRDFGIRKAAHGLLDDIDKHANLDPSSPERRHLYPRYCQVNHLRALLYSDGGRKTEAISLLQGLLIHADRELYNRALMWIILDLAVLLRARGKPGDKEQAEANFNHVVRTRSADDKNAKKGGSADADSIQEAEPDPPRLLRFAEQALLLVRARKFDQVEKLFEKQNLEWFRSEDIWITYGSPAADTAWMKGP